MVNLRIKSKLSRVSMEDLTRCVISGRRPFFLIKIKMSQFLLSQYILLRSTTNTFFMGSTILVIPIFKVIRPIVFYSIIEGVLKRVCEESIASIFI